MYRGEYLAGYAGEAIIFGYEPRDITEVLVYRKENNKKASSRKVRKAGLTIV